jgi:hypothetical protein
VSTEKRRFAVNIMSFLSRWLKMFSRTTHPVSSSCEIRESPSKLVMCMLILRERIGERCVKVFAHARVRVCMCGRLCRTQ